MKVTVLGSGTSQGVPVIGCRCVVCQSLDQRDHRLRSSVHIGTESTSIVIDIGPDFRQQMLGNGIEKVDAILITHEHNDHVVGLDEVRPFNFQLGSDMPLYCSKRVLGELMKRFAYIFKDDRYPGKPRIQFEIINSGDRFRIGDINIEVIEVLHGNLMIYGFRFGKFCYITDAKKIDDSELEKLKDIEVLIINALHHHPHPTHLNVEESVELIAKINPQRAYLTHISHSMGLRTEVEPSLPENVFLAYDGLSFDFDQGSAELFS